METNVETRPSLIGGTGVFAQKRFETGAFIRELKVAREVTAETPLRADENPEHAFMADGRYLLVDEPDRYLNHSCDPNAYKRYTQSRIELIARRTIEVGEEITLDYLINNAGGDTWPCHCGATRCRGMTGTSFFDLPEEFQREYFPLLAPWFKRRYVDRLAHLT